MSETLHLKQCPVCQSGLSITHDKLEDVLTLRPENLPSLAKDRIEVVTAYKRLKGLGASWQKSHGARGLIYAGTLLDAVGVHGGQLDRAIALLGWCQEMGKDYSLDTAATYYGEYCAHLERVRVKFMGRCTVCGESYTKTGFLDDNCGRHG